MARPRNQDFLRNMRFFVQVVDLGGTGAVDTLGTGNDPAKPPAQVPKTGFSAITMPELTVENVEYREGHRLYAMKFPGNTTVNDITMSRGVSGKDTAFYDLIMRVVEGGGEYRADLSILHYGREATQPGQSQPGKQASLANLAAVPNPRTILVYEAFPTRYKPGSDLDGSSSDVSIMEVDFAFEHFEVIAEQ